MQSQRFLRSYCNFLGNWELMKHRIVMELFREQSTDWNLVESSRNIQWLQFFLERNLELPVRQSEGSSISLKRSRYVETRSQAVFWPTGNNSMWTQFVGKPHKIEESGIQLNKFTRKSGWEKGIQRCSSPNFKRKRWKWFCHNMLQFGGNISSTGNVWEEKWKFFDGFLAETGVYMNPKSSYVPSELFMKRLKENFTPRKNPGKILLILDEHSAHLDNIKC